MKLTFKERKELADLEYGLQVAFYNYEDRKQLNLTQKGTLKDVFDFLHKILEENANELLASGKMSDYFKEIYGVDRL